jgi:hypothetical protein
MTFAGCSNSVQNLRCVCWLLLLVCWFCIYGFFAEAQEFKKGFEEAAEHNSSLINMAAVPSAGGDGTAAAADELADELSQTKVDGGEEPAAATPAAAKEEEA